MYVVTVWSLLPYAPRVGRAITATAFGAWLLGPGLTWLLAIAAALLLVRLYRRDAPAWAYVTLVATAAAYAVAFAWLRSARLERTHLPEYGVAAWLAWRAVGPLVPGTAAGYAAAAVLGAAIGLADELLQKLVPGRVYDIRDVGLNALGAVLGVIVLAALRARPRSGLF